MYINGRRVYNFEFERDDSGKVIFTQSECEICQGSGTFRIKINYQDSEFWDDIEIVDICDDCLIISGLVLDEEDLEERIR